MKLRTWCIRMGQILTKTVLVFTGYLIFLILFNPAISKAEDDRGGITIRQQNAPIEKVFQSIEKQSGYRFFYNETLLQGAGKVTINLQNVSLQEALNACFYNQPLSYAIVDKTIIVKRRHEQQPKAPEAAAVTLSAPGKIIALRGKVTSGDVPVPDASVIIKGTDNGVKSDKDGMFTLPEVEDDATLVISSVSHQAKEVRLNGQTFVNIDLSTKTNDLDEAIVVAYNTTTRKMNTGAVSVVKGEQIQNLPNRSVDKSLQGLVPGLLVTSGSGQPGSGLSNFVLRGIATGDNNLDGSTVRNPLIVIDGIPVTQDHMQWTTSVGETPVINPMAQLNPSDIESISVLKDASAIALYGSKASNGVILITTKSGKAGKTTINLSHQTDIAKRLKGKIELLNQDEYLELLYESYRNFISPLYPNDDSITADLKRKFPVRSDGSFYPETNWEDELYTDQATTVSNGLSFSGGTEKSNFYLNLEYTKQNGIFKETGFDRKSIRFNFENRPTNWFKLGLNSTLSYNIQDYASLVGVDYPVGMATYMSPLNPVRKEDGTYVLNFTYPTKGSNPVASAEYNMKRNTSYRGLSKIYGEISLLKSLKLTSSFGVDFMLLEAKEKTDPRLYDDAIFAQGTGRVRERDTRNANLISTNILRFDKTINNKHSINLLLGHEAQVMTLKYLDGTSTGLRFFTNDQISNGTTKTSDGGYTKQTLLSYFGQANYSYEGKYLFTGSIRRDGSSRFGENDRFGTYWSTGVGWVISEESFMKQMTSVLDYLKIRGSIGEAGNSFGISKFTKYDFLVTGAFLNDIAVYPQGVNPGNLDIKWEETFTWDAGVEAKLWKGRIALTADIYKRKTSDVIYSTLLPLATGYGSVLDNIGDMENKGVELSLSVDVIKNKNFRWNINANWSKNRNILVKANVPLAGVTGGTLGNEEGRNFNSFYLKQWAGVDAENGNPLWMDSTGKASSDFNAAKKEFVGKPQPDGFGSVTNTVSYKNLQLSAILYYQYGFQVYNGSALNNDGTSPFVNQDRSALDRWQNKGDNAKNPKRILNNNTKSTEFSTRYLFDGDFIRLQNITLSYLLPSKMTRLMKLSTFRLFVQGHNLVVWSKFPGGDLSNADAQGSVRYSYPNQRFYTLGLNIGL